MQTGLDGHPSLGPAVRWPLCLQPRLAPVLLCLPGHGMTAAARAMVHGAQVVGQKTAEGATTASYATIEAGVRTSRFLEDYVVDPTARGYDLSLAASLLPGSGRVCL